jgi:hypothetical protein
MRSTVRLAAAALALVMVTTLVFAGSARAIEPKAWDQESATKLATELAEIIGELRRSVRIQADEDPNVARRSSQRVVENLRSLQTRTRQLSRRLEAGEGSEETDRLFRRIQTLVIETQIAARGMAKREENQPRVDRVFEIMDQLGAYYMGVGDDLPPVASGDEPEED